MAKIKENIANNIVELRKINNLTQAELAEKLNFTDKAISKWERGESTPDIESLANMASLFNVSVDDLLSENLNKSGLIEENKFTISKNIAKLALAIVTIWFIGTAIFVYGIIDHSTNPNLWMAFIWPLPASGLLLFAVSCIRKKRKCIPFASSFTLWTFLTALYLQLLAHNENMWIIYIIGIPLQLIIIITYWINK